MENIVESDGALSHAVLERVVEGVRWLSFLYSPLL